MTVEFTNMIMITDPDTDKVVVINRTKSWCGPSFPGGHLEKGEAFSESAKREVLEETGLTLNSLEPCGLIHWINTDTDARYVVMCYKSDDFSGTLKSGDTEGTLSWMRLEDIPDMYSENDFKLYLPLFRGECTEAVGYHNKDGNRKFYYI